MGMVEWNHTLYNTNAMRSVEKFRKSWKWKRGHEFTPYSIVSDVLDVLFSLTSARNHLISIMNHRPIVRLKDANRAWDGHRGVIHVVKSLQYTSHLRHTYLIGFLAIQDLRIGTEHGWSILYPNRILLFHLCYIPTNTKPQSGLHLNTWKIFLTTSDFTHIFAFFHWF